MKFSHCLKTISTKNLKFSPMITNTYKTLKKSFEKKFRYFWIKFYNILYYYY